MTSQFVDDTPSLLTRCSELRNLLFEAGPRPAAESRAAMDNQSFRRRTNSSEVSERVIVCCDYWTIVTANQLRSLATLIEVDGPGFAIYPIMRAIIEHSAWLCWMLDENCSALERISRANLAFLNTAKGRVAAALLAYGSESELHGIAMDDYDKYLHEMNHTFTDVQVGRNMSIEGQRLPTATGVIAHMGSIMGNENRWKGVYKVLCQMANHPTLSVTEVISLDHGQTLSIRISPETLSQNVLATLNPYLWSLNYVCAYLGWPTKPLDDLFDEFEKM